MKKIYIKFDGIVIVHAHSKSTVWCQNGGGGACQVFVMNLPRFISLARAHTHYSTTKLA